MRRRITFLMALLLTVIGLNAQTSPGDIAFIAFNADGTDDLAFVTLVDIPANTAIWFTDNEWVGAGFNDTNEGEIEWSHTSLVSAGTVIVINDISASSPIANIGTATGGGCNLGASNEALFALLEEPTTSMSSVTFLAGISNDLSGSGATLTGTGLTSGTDFLDFANDDDGFKYIGSTSSEASFTDFLPLIMDITNWQDEDSDGTLILPITTTAFTLSTSEVPLILITPTTLSDFTYGVGNGPSTSQSFSVSGSNLTDDITVTPSDNYEISEDDVTFQNTAITLLESEGEVASTTIYVRLASGLEIGDYDETISCTSTDADTKEIAVSGSVTNNYDYTEDFTNFPVTGSSYLSGSFTGNDFDWTYVYTSASNPIEAPAPLFGKGKDPAASVSTLFFSGIGILNFDYMQGYSTNVNLKVMVNGDSITTVTSTSQQGIVLNSGDIEINVSGIVELEFIQLNTAAGQVSIDNISWTSYGNPTQTLPYSEDFDDCETIGWESQSVASTKDWSCGSGYMEVNAYGGDEASDDYLISPSFNMDYYNDEVLTFESYNKYSDSYYPPIELLYSTDYAGDATTATWNSLTATWCAENGQTWTSSGSVDVSGISGSDVYFAFHYTSSGTGSGTSSQWRIDNVSIIEAGTPILSATASLTEIDSSFHHGTAEIGMATVSASDLTEKIVVSAPTNFMISSNGVDFKTDTIELPATGGSVYAKLQSGLTFGYYTDELILTSAGAANDTIALSGTAYIYIQKFDSDLGDFVQYSDSGDQVWYQSASGDNGFAKMSGYASSTSYGNGDWLISPAIDLTGTTNEIVSFQTVKNYFDSEEVKDLKVLFTTNYESGDPNEVYWVDVTQFFTLAPSDGWTPWTLSGGVKVSSLNTTTARIAFYYTSTEAEAGTWEIDNVAITQGVGISTNTAPVITATNNPILPNETQDVQILATAIDLNGSIASMEVQWGTSSSALTNSIAMVSTGVDDTYASISNIPAQAAETDIYYQVVATDDEGESGYSSKMVYTTAFDVTIQEIQETSDASGISPYFDEVVHTTGIVTYPTYADDLSQNGFYMQDGIGDWSGLYVYTADTDNPDVAEGDEVDVTGYVYEIYGQTRITGILVVEILSSGNIVPSTSVLMDVPGEKDESVLSTVSYAKMHSSAIDGMGVFEMGIGDGGTMPVYVGDTFYTYDGSFNINEPYTVTGIVDHSTHSDYTSYPFRILPRDASDVSKEVVTEIAENSVNATIYAANKTIILNGVNGLFSIYNVAGKTVYQGTSSSTITKISIPAEGVYFIKTSSSVTKVIVQ